MVTFYGDLCTEKFKVVVRGNIDELTEYINLYSLHILECIFIRYRTFCERCGFENVRNPFPDTTLFEIGKTYSADGISVSLGIEDDCVVANVVLVAIMPDEEASRATIVDPEAVSANDDIIQFR